MNTVIFAVRHGETEWNAAGRQQGHLDSPLTANGRKQAQLVAEGLVEKNIDILVSSDLGRALETAKIIARRLSLNIQSDARLRERHLGIMQGLAKTEFLEKYPEEAMLHSANDPDYVLPGGESARQQFDRCIDCVQDLAGNNAGKRILIVGHGGILACLFNKAVNMPLNEPRRFNLFNGSINSVCISGGKWRLDSWGVMSHLKGVKSLDNILL